MGIAFFGRLRELRVGNRIEAAVGDADHGCNVDGNGENARMGEPQLSGDECFRYKRRQHGSYSCCNLKYRIREILLSERFIYKLEIRTQRNVSVSEKINDIAEGGKAVTEA